jgi:hypothetical protein
MRDLKARCTANGMDLKGRIGTTGRRIDDPDNCAKGMGEARNFGVRLRAKYEQIKSVGASGVAHQEKDRHGKYPEATARASPGVSHAVLFPPF